MQILETSMAGLRSARLTFKKSDPPTSVTLFPMVHVAEERFYAEVFAEALACDVVLVEGIRSSVSRNLTRSYRWMNLTNLGLVRQPRLSSEMATAAKIVRADLEADEFHHEWKKVRLHLRVAFHVFSPLYGLLQRLLASRRSLAKTMALEDLQSSDEVLSWNPDFESVGRSFIEARDERLIQHLEAELSTGRQSEKRIAIVYGARHMRAVIRKLTKLGFKSAEAKWMVVFKT